MKAPNLNPEGEHLGLSYPLAPGNVVQQKGEATMKAAINELTIALETMETNEPINRTNGNTEQADLEASNAADFRKALAVLNAVQIEPI